jgi:transposase InsO family protein
LRVAVAKAFVSGQSTAAELSKVYGVSSFSVYKWGQIYRSRGEAGLTGGLRAPRGPKPKPVPDALAQEIVETKRKFSWFGIRRLSQWLRRSHLLPVTESQVEKTLEQARLVTHRPKKRRRRAQTVRFFERSEPNQLWQVDITMWTTGRGQKVYLIAFLDDYSRYIVGWGLYAAQGSSQVLEVLRNAVAQYGTPREILSDQGRQFYAWRGKCPFQRELAREGIQHVVSRSHHPQTLGKIEAFWKHLKEEFLARVVAGSINDLRERLRYWIDSFYNFQRPHQGIGNLVPADRFFKTADTVRHVIEKGVAANAERLALGQEPVKPFYMVGRMGDQAVVIRQEGSEVVMDVGSRPVETVQLNGGPDATEATRGSDGGGGSPGEGPGAGGAPDDLGRETGKPSLPGDGTPTPPVLQARVPDPQGDGPGCPGEPHGGTETQCPAGLGGPGGAQPPAPAGQPADAGTPAADAQTLQNGPETPKNEGFPGKAPQDGDAGGAHDKPADNAS